jgi:hypothetical protein
MDGGPRYTGAARDADLGNLDRARLEALVAFPTSLPAAYSQYRVGRAVLNDEEDIVLQASENGQPVLNCTSRRRVCS